ncbi:PREDICTED: tumor suppressor candidate 3 [Nicrophorus vespilloides]|uniref:Tumor suppressor candidate 3 n=1 Tax=Nicrophorus vespilloides TaxID=110193 RepID=A0ABM1M5H4_NICVS|nr:PREDICTED: tumor suppressor candidate 3 [Nicrophorus vespilloides]
MKGTLLFCLIVISSIFFYHADGQARKGGMTMAERVQQLSDMAAKKALLKFNGNKFRDYVKSTPRNYSVIVMFTAMAPQRQCMVCKHAHDEFTIVANSFKYSQSYSNKLFFAVVDFDEGSEVFQMMRLNTAPVFIHFPAKGKPKNTDTMDIQRIGFSAESIAKWIGERTDIQIRVFRPPNYSSTLALVFLFIFLAGLLYMRRNNLEFLYNKNLWAVGALFFCFMMVSGQMWNHIRGPPFFHKGQNGQISYIHGSSQGQLVIETYIVMVLNAAVVLGMILLTESANKNTDPKKKKVFAIAGLVLLTVFFSLILSVFRSKTQGYPYSFLFK